MLSFTSLRFGHRCWGPLSLNVVALPLLAYEFSVYLRSRNSTGEEPGGLIPPPLPTLYFNWHSRSVLLHVGLFTLKVIFLCNLFLDFLHILTSCELSKIICSREENWFPLSAEKRKKGGKRRAGTSFVFFMVFVPQNKDPQKAAIP